LRFGSTPSLALTLPFPSLSRRFFRHSRSAWWVAAFRRLRNSRVGIEARISHLNRGFGLRRMRLRRVGGALSWVGLGIFAYNLQRMTVIAR
jgi:transposase, IS5 family